MKKEPKTGERVAHRSLDDSKGAARSGVAVDVIGDQEQSLVIVEGEEGREAFDTREMVSLGPAGQSSGPVVLRPSHLRAVLRRRQSLLAIIFELVLIAALVLAVMVKDLSGTPLVVLACAVLVIGMIGIVVLERDAQREDRKPSGR